MPSSRRKPCAPAVFYAAVAAAAALIAPARVRAAVSTDGSVGPARSLPGPNFAVTPDLGKRAGGNLFHSFRQFDLARGETATFTGPASGPAVQNVLARVTGGSASSIDGTIRCTIPNADFYLVNPAGVVFGPDARLDVQGSFAVTTADHLKLADGGRFAATATPADSVLTTAAPAAFGFLSPRPAGISIQGASLAVPAGRVLTLAGGPVRVDGGTLAAPGGRVNVLAAGSPGDVRADPGSPSAAVDVTGVPIRADVDLAGVRSDAGEATPARVDVDGDAGGRVVVRGADVRLADAVITGRTLGAAAGGGVDVVATGAFSLARSTIDTSAAGGGGAAGGISVAAAVVSVDGVGGPAALRADTTGVLVSDLQVGLDVTGETGARLSARLSSPVPPGAFDGAGAALLDFTPVGATDPAAAAPLRSVFTLDPGAGRTIGDAGAPGGPTPPYAGSYKPADDFKPAFGGVPARGPWTLNLSSDQAAVRLNGWSLRINGRPVVATDVPKTAEGPIGEATSVLPVDLPVGSAGAIRVTAGSVASVAGDVVLSATSPDPGHGVGSVGIAAPTITLDGGPASFRPDGAGGGRFHRADGLVLDGTLAGGGAGPVPLVGGTYTLTEAMGRRSGGNLFYSFSQFNLNPAETADFAPAMETDNVVARVTGGTASTIAGTVKCEQDGTAVYLINPAGVVLGRGAALEVGGSVAFTTADALGFAAGGRFPAAGPVPGDLPADPPAAFAFTNVRPAPISVGAAGLDLAAGFNGDGTTRALWIVGGDVRLTGATVFAADGQGGGALQVVGGASAGVASFDTAAADLAVRTDFARYGDVRLNGSSLNADLLAVRGGDVELTGTSAVGGLHVQVRGQDRVSLGPASSLTASGGIDFTGTSVAVESPGGAISLNGATVSATSHGAIDLAAQSVVVTNKTTVRSFAQDGVLVSEGSVGDIHVDARSVDISDSTISTAANDFAPGGNIRIGTAARPLDLLTLRAGGTIASSGNFGNAGNIDVFATRLSASGGARLTASTDASGAAGTIRIVGDRVDLTGGATVSAVTTAITSTFRDTVVTGGPGGAILIQTGDLSMSGGARITTATTGVGAGGNIQVGAARDVNMLGAGTGILASTGAPVRYFDEGRGAIVVAAAPGGGVLLQARSLRLDAGASVVTSTAGRGRAGDVTVTAANGVSLAAGSRIEAGTAGDGDAGGVAVTAGTVVLTGGSQIASTTRGFGRGGGITVAAQRDLRLDGRGTALRADADPPDPATAVSVFVRPGGFMLGGAGGDDAPQLTLIGPSGRRVALTPGVAVRGPADSPADGIVQYADAGGDARPAEPLSALRGEGAGVWRLMARIDGPAGPSQVLNVPTDFVLRLNGREFHAFRSRPAVGDVAAAATLTTVVPPSSSTALPSDAGSVTVTAGRLVVDRGAGVRSSAAGGARGGNVAVVADRAFVGRGAELTATAAGGRAGSISVGATHGLRLVRGRVTTATAGPGGQVTLMSDRGSIVVLDRSVVSAEAASEGVVILNAAGTVFAGESRITAMVTGSDGGQIAVDPRFVVLRDSTIDGRAHGGARDVPVDIDARSVFVRSAGSAILSNQANVPVATDISGALQGLPPARPGTPPQLVPQCGLRLGGDVSSFLLTGRGGEPPQPGGWMPAAPTDDEVGGILLLPGKPNVGMPSAGR